VQDLQSHLRHSADLAIAKAYSSNSRDVIVYSYIFVRDPQGRWKRNRSGELVDQVIQAQLGP
jgi:hypothetical protein